MLTFCALSLLVLRERFGTIAAEDITELPSEYKELEARVDALKAAHLSFLKFVAFSLIKISPRLMTFHR